MDDALLQSFAENRSRFYWFLSSFYLEKPSEGFLDDLKSRISEVDLKVDGELVDSLARIGETLRDTNVNKLSQHLLKEYTRLMRGVKKGYGPPPPYESVYRGEGRVDGEVTLEIMRFYNEAGFGFDDYPGPKDYLGIELRFMAFLCHEEMNAWKESDFDKGLEDLKIQERFLDKHILQMVPAFSSKVIRESKEDFYVDVVRLTDRFTEQDLENLRFLLKELDK